MKKSKIQAEEEFRCRVSKEDSYNAFTDLVYYQGKFWVAYRTGKGHVSPHGKIIIRSSEDGKDWELIEELHQEGLDLRDPRLAVLDGKLVLLCFSLDYWNKVKYKFHASDSYIYLYDRDRSRFQLEHRFDYEKHKTTLWSVAKLEGKYYLGG